MNEEHARLGNRIVEKHNFLTGFTLVELIIVVLIVGIIVAFAMPQFRVTQERALDLEAKSVLSLMRAAERIYKMEIGFWYPNTGTLTDLSAINTNLKLSLPTAAPKWNYGVNSAGTIQGIRSGGGWIRTWTLESSGTYDTPPSSACTPNSNCL